MAKKKEVLEIERADFEELIHELLKHIKIPNGDDNPWILPSEAMSMLGIKSKSHFWKLKTEGCFEISTPSRKVQLINRNSVLSYIEKHKNPAF